ncbi:MAG: PAS domain S-box protein [Kiritimatiellia bacterium]
MLEKEKIIELEKRILELERIQVELNNTQDRLTEEINWRRRITDESRDGLVVLTLDGAVFEANRRFADMLGYSLEELRHLHVWEWDGALDKDNILELLENVDEGGHFFETKHRCKDGSLIDVELSNNGAFCRDKKLIFCICRDVTARKQFEKEREELIKKLQESLAEIRTLRGILPLCSFCKNVRDDKGYWEQVETYIRKHSDMDISHSICPECLKKHYPDEYKTMCSGGM